MLVRVCVFALTVQICLSGRVYDVGPGQDHTDPAALPWNRMKDGDTIRIHYRETPYKTQLYIGWSNFTISCIPGPGGAKPIIDGDGATASSRVSFFNLDRALVRIGESENPPSKIILNALVEGCELRNANRSSHGYRLDSWKPGYYQPWAENASAIQATGVKNLVIRNNYIHDNNVGASAFSVYPSRVSENCQIVNNVFERIGGEGDSQNHVTYTECAGELLQGNTSFQPANWSSVFKSRGVRTRIYSNYIDGGDAAADLVDSANMRNLKGNADPDVIANNFITRRAGYDNDRYVHFGGDSGNVGAYRHNTLYLINNTVYSQRNGNVLVRVSSWHQKVVLMNNVIQWKYMPTYGFYLALSSPGKERGPLGEQSSLSYSHNWIQKGSCPYRDYPMQFCGLEGNLKSSDLGGNVWAVSRGMGNVQPQTSPGWDAKFHPVLGSPLIDAGRTPALNGVDWTFGGTRTIRGSNIDVGAYEIDTER